MINKRILINELCNFECNKNCSVQQSVFSIILLFVVYTYYLSIKLINFPTTFKYHDNTSNNYLYYHAIITGSFQYLYKILLNATISYTKPKYWY